MKGAEENDTSLRKTADDITRENLHRRSSRDRDMTPEMRTYSKEAPAWGVWLASRSAYRPVLAQGLRAHGNHRCCR
jgi:hypothetical protein